VTVRRYVWLLLCVLGLALALSALARAPRRTPIPVPPPPRHAPIVSVRLEIRGGTIAPAFVRVPKGARIALVVANEDRREARISLPGYEDRLAPISVAPGSTWSGSFVADRPGDDFAWMLDDRPAAKLEVEGSHLVDGHL
jgi:hypothetical protein